MDYLKGLLRQVRRQFNSDDEDLIEDALKMCAGGIKICEHNIQHIERINKKHGKLLAELKGMKANFENLKKEYMKNGRN